MFVPRFIKIPSPSTKTTCNIKVNHGFINVSWQSSKIEFRGRKLKKNEPCQSASAAFRVQRIRRRSKIVRICVRKQLYLIYQLQRLVTLSAFVFVILLCNVCYFGLLQRYGFFVNLDSF